MEANGVNYYKGVLLCSRPNESPSITRKKEFCGRVVPPENLGILPVKHFDERKTRKRVLPVLNNHKKWLEQFKKEIKQDQLQHEQDLQKQARRLQRIKQQAHQHNQLSPPKDIGSKQVEQKAVQQKKELEQRREAPKTVERGDHKKKSKPAWAKTAEEVEANEEEEVDELLSFFSAEKPEEIKDYLSDGEVKNILLDLKAKIENLKGQEDWKQKHLRRIEKQRAQGRERDRQDKESKATVQSGGSVASQRTAERIQELQRKKKEQEWDKLTTSEKRAMANVDQQIAKNIADEVLRNYPALKHHSNQSIRQLLERQAQDQIKG